MSGLFPDSVQVPQGFVKPRMVWPGIPPAIWTGLLFLTGMPVAVFRTFWTIPPCIVIAFLIALEARKDPQFWKAWIGEVRLAKEYR